MSTDADTPTATTAWWHSQIATDLDVTVGGRTFDAVLVDVETGLGQIDHPITLRIRTDDGTLSVPPSLVETTDSGVE